LREGRHQVPVQVQVQVQVQVRQNLLLDKTLGVQMRSRESAGPVQKHSMNGEYISAGFH
jgi:hypothetical protein